MDIQHKSGKSTSFSQFCEREPRRQSIQQSGKDSAGEGGRVAVLCRPRLMIVDDVTELGSQIPMRSYGSEIREATWQHLTAGSKVWTIIIKGGHVRITARGTDPQRAMKMVNRIRHL